MNKKMIVGISALVLGGIIATTGSVISHAIYLGEYNGENLEKKLINEGKTAYVDTTFADEIRKLNTEMRSNKKGETVTFTFKVPTWTSVKAGRGEWIERIAGNGANVAGPGMGVPGYDIMYYGDSDKYSGTFTIDNLSVSTSDTSLANISVASSVNKADHTATIITTIKLKKDIEVNNIPLTYTANDIVMGTTVVDSTNSNQYNIPLPVQDVSLANNTKRSVLTLGSTNIVIKADTAKSTTNSSQHNISLSAQDVSLDHNTKRPVLDLGSTNIGSENDTITRMSTNSSQYNMTLPEQEVKNLVNNTKRSMLNLGSTNIADKSDTITSTTDQMISRSSSKQSKSKLENSSKAKKPIGYIAARTSTTSSSNAPKTITTKSNPTSNVYYGTKMFPKTGEQASIMITSIGLLVTGLSAFYLVKYKLKNK